MDTVKKQVLALILFTLFLNISSAQLGYYNTKLPSIQPSSSVSTSSANGSYWTTDASQSGLSGTKEGTFNLKTSGIYGGNAFIDDNTGVYNGMGVTLTGIQFYTDDNLITSVDTSGNWNFGSGVLTGDGSGLFNLPVSSANFTNVAFTNKSNTFTKAQYITPGGISTDKNFLLNGYLDTEAFSIDGIGNVLVNSAGYSGGGNYQTFSKVETDVIKDIFNATLDRGSGSGGNGLGLRYSFNLESGGGNRANAGNFIYKWFNSTGTKETSSFVIQTKDNGKLTDAIVVSGNNSYFNGTLTTSDKISINAKTTTGEYMKIMNSNNKTAFKVTTAYDPLNIVSWNINQSGWLVIGADYYTGTNMVNRIDIQSVQGTYIAGPLYPSGTVLMARVTNATSTATQQYSNPLYFQTSLWNGSLAFSRTHTIIAKPSNTENGVSYLDFVVQNLSGSSIDAMDIRGDNGLISVMGAGINITQGNFTIAKQFSPLPSTPCIVGTIAHNDSNIFVCNSTGRFRKGALTF